ncbi:MAG TPA: helix-turn-helix domain-containing protein [Polyangiaceae bacterium]|nr:helix-turn-helix domain-containing protein [Polyangiaceae bacterium]
MKSYGQFCPVAQALEVVGERWTLLVIRELLSGSRRFGEILNGVRRIPRSVLANRLEQLERAGLIRREIGALGPEYEPTDAARALEEVVMGLGLWARRWAHRNIRDDELDPTLLLWDMQRRIDAKAAPEKLVVVRFDFLESGKGYLRYWLKIDHGRGEVCMKNPGLEETLVVQTRQRVLTEVWMGYRDFSSVIRSGELTIEGPSALARALPSWFQLNVFVQLEQGEEASVPSRKPAAARRKAAVTS